MPQEPSEALAGVVAHLEVRLEPAGVGVFIDTPGQGGHSFEKTAFQLFPPAPAVTS